MLRAVIFDMGETLLRFVRPGNTWREFEAPGIREIYQYLIEQGHPIASREEEFVEVMFQRLAEGWQQSTGGHINLRAVDWIATSAADHALTLDEAALLEAARHYARSLRIGLSATPGATDVLAALRERDYRMGLISNTIWPAELHLEDLAEFGILPYLDHTIFSGDFGMWKPSPQVFQHMMEILDVRPEETVFVGDNPREDILGAQGVGIRAVWLRNHEFPLGDVHPDAIIETLPDLLTVLEQWHTQ